jgi:archaellum component FlaC
MILREREYDLRSWHGVKTVASVIIAVVGVVAAVLTAYYSAEASQNDTISQQATSIATQKQRLDDRDKGLSETFKKFDDTLNEQRKVLTKTTEAVVRIDTRQEVLIERVEKISDKLNK